MIAPVKVSKQLYFMFSIIQWVFLFVAYPMSLVAHRFAHVEFQIFVLIFSNVLAFKKHQQIFEIRHVQIHELPRT